MPLLGVRRIRTKLGGNGTISAVGGGCGGRTLVFDTNKAGNKAGTRHAATTRLFVSWGSCEITLLQFGFLLCVWFGRLAETKPSLLVLQDYSVLVQLLIRWTRENVTC